MKTMSRKPTSPGEILNEEFLVPMGLTQKEMADHIRCDIKVINGIINERTSVTAEMALKLSSAFKMMKLIKKQPDSNRLRYNLSDVASADATLTVIPRI